ncbi:hypothetical protein [Streptacidiphilus sp. MAP5-52]
MPLDQAPIDRPTRAELRAAQAQRPLDDELENGPSDGCSPFACRGDAA